jgi:hypothetical protein
MIIATQEKALVNFDNITTISVESIETVKNDSIDEENESTEEIKEYQYYIVADAKDKYIPLGKYNSLNDAVKVITMVITNAITLGAEVIMMPTANGIDEAILDIIKVAQREETNNDNTENV